MNELNNTLMSTEIGAEVTGYVLADVRGVNSIPNPLTVQHPPGAALQLPHHPGGITGMLFTRVHLRDTTKTYHLAIIGKMVSHS